MSGDRLATLAFLLIALTLPLSSLIVRRVPIGEAARLALIWLAIIAGGAALVAAVHGTPIWTKLAQRISAIEPHDPNGPTMLTLHNIYYQDE